MGDNIEKRKPEIGFSDRVLAIDDHFTYGFIGDAGCAEIIIADVWKIKCDRVPEIFESADFE